MMRRPYRAARRRRRFGRYDPSPVLLVTEDDRTLYLGSAFRMAWRYRSELVPFTTALCMLVYGVWAHSRNPGGAWLLAGLTAASTAVLGLPPGRWPGRAGRAVVRLLDRWAVYSRRLERLYAASVVALAGAWLAAATRWGPGTAPLPAVLLLGTLAAGVPWWTHHRRRERVRVTRLVDAWPTFSDSIGLPGSRVVSILVDRWGWSGRLALRRGQTVAQAIASADRIESAIKTRPGAVRIEPDPARADRAILRVLDTDPLAAPIPWPDPAHRPAPDPRVPDEGPPVLGQAVSGQAPSILSPVELGIFEDGAPILVRLAYRNVLLGGMIGSGKSGVLNVLTAYLAACRDVAVWGIDLKGGMELGPWAGCLGRLATTPRGAEDLLRDALAVRDQRMQPGERLWTPTRSAPALIIVIDEFARMTQFGKELAESLATVGRAVMVNLIIATQRPTQDTLGGGALRSQCEVRICLRMRERRDVDLILDRGAWAAGWRGDVLDEAGKLLLSDPEHTTPKVGRGYLFTDQNVTTTAADNTGHQPVIPIPPDPYDPHDDDEDNTDRQTRSSKDHPRSDDFESGAIDPVGADPAGATNRDEADGGEEEDGDGEDEAGRHAADAVAALWHALSTAPAEGLTATELTTQTRMSRRWVYYRLNALAADGRAIQTDRGRWRATRPPVRPRPGSDPGGPPDSHPT